MGKRSLNTPFIKTKDQACFTYSIVFARQQRPYCLTLAQVKWRDHARTETALSSQKYFIDMKIPWWKSAHRTVASIGPAMHCDRQTTDDRLRNLLDLYLASCRKIRGKSEWRTNGRRTEKGYQSTNNGWRKRETITEILKWLTQNFVKLPRWLASSTSPLYTQSPKNAKTLSRSNNPSSKI